MTTLYKVKRTQDKKLLEEIRQQGCMICGSRPVHAHHIKTKGSGGGDTFDNLAPLCPRHHVEVHQLGTKTFASKYPHILLTGKKWSE